VSSAERPIAVVCALECELAHLRAAIADAEEDWFADRCAWPGALDGQRVVLSVCGMGMTSAAAVTESVITRYQPLAVLNSGCAGAHRQDLLPGDVVVADRVVAYDSVREAPDGTLSFGMMHYLYRGAPRRVSALSADTDLLDLARRVARQMQGAHDPWPADLGWPGGVPHRSPRVAVGTVVSADRWNRAESSIRALATQFDSLCEDMEAAAVGLVCASHDVPFLAVKDIVNNELLRATSSGRALLTEVGEHQLGRRAAAFVLGLLRQVRESAAPARP
jgi:adenosylhomocysteine nucleosidase